MSAVEPQEREQHSSIKVVRNAKGDAQFEVKVVAGETDSALDAMRAQAVGQYRALGIEVEERYCEIAAQRCSQEVLALEAV